MKCNGTPLWLAILCWTYHAVFKWLKINVYKTLMPALNARAWKERVDQGAGVLQRGLSRFLKLLVTSTVYFYIKSWYKIQFFNIFLSTICNTALLEVH